MDEQVGGDSPGIIPIASPLEKTSRIPGPLGGWAEPGFPIEVYTGLSISLNIVSPEILFVISGIVDLSHHHLPQCAGLDVTVGDFVGLIRHSLDSYLQLKVGPPNLADQILGLLDGVGHRFFKVDVLAGTKGIQGHPVMPVFWCSNQYVVEVLL